MNRQLPRLHAITNDEVLSYPDFLARATQATASADLAIHIRSGILGGRQLRAKTEATTRACPGGFVFVNDRADVARSIGAAGLHLPAAGLSVADARAIVGDECFIGRSTHGTEEVIQAEQEGADYVFLGPIWSTASHPGTEPLGSSVLEIDSRIPVIAIGGITPERTPECLARGAYGVAVISALWQSSDPGSTVRSFSLSFPS